MAYFTLAIFFLNIFLLLIISGNIKKMAMIRQDFVEIENNIARMVQENSRLIDIILAESEHQLAAGTKTPEPQSAESKSAQLQTEPAEPQPALKKRFTPAEFQVCPTGLNIIDLRKEGLSIQEIAEKTGVPQGEITLTLNLYEKTVND